MTARRRGRDQRSDPTVQRVATEATVESELNSALAPGSKNIWLPRLMARCLASALHAIGTEAPDGSRSVAAEVAKDAVPAAFVELVEQLTSREDNPIDISDPDRLTESIEAILTEDEETWVLDFVNDVLGGSQPIAELFETASYSPAHSSQTMYLESFTWRGAVWCYEFGVPEAQEPFEAWFLHVEGDADQRRSAMLGLAEEWFGAGLENDDDPEIRQVARSASWLVQSDRFNWYDDFEDWETEGLSNTADELIVQHAELIARRLGRSVADVAVAIRQVTKPVDWRTEKAPWRRLDRAEQLPPAEQELRQELWWMLNRT